MKLNSSEANQNQGPGNYLKIIQEEAIKVITKQQKAKLDGSEANQNQGAGNYLKILFKKSQSRQFPSNRR